jgi:hypothetical protein
MVPLSGRLGACSCLADFTIFARPQGIIGIAHQQAASVHLDGKLVQQKTKGHRF